MRVINFQKGINKAAIKLSEAVKNKVKRTEKATKDSKSAHTKTRNMNPLPKPTPKTYMYTNMYGTYKAYIVKKHYLNNRISLQIWDSADETRLDTASYNNDNIHILANEAIIPDSQILAFLTKHRIVRLTGKTVMLRNQIEAPIVTVLI